MKPVIQKLPLAENASFYVHTHTTPTFEYVWHQHIEYELILMKKGMGLVFIGTYTGEYEKGDIFFIGKNVPHFFQKKDSDAIASALVIQFKEDLLGRSIADLPEARLIKLLFEKSILGIKVKDEKEKQQLTQLLLEMENTEGFGKTLKLMEAIHYMSNCNSVLTLSTHAINSIESKSKERLDKVFHYTIDTFKKNIALDEIAKIASMSVPSFCKYFKNATGKTYVDFLNEVRIGYACNLLIDSDMNISEIAYDSGFNTIAHFNRQFTKIKNCKPSDFRKKYLSFKEIPK